ncbi:MAG TPA: response regulator, partial [Candidatus Limnocylindrales bacterium]|nr:response regulator [Candidatus Limnocylindrales bacterium]
MTDSTRGATALIVDDSAVNRKLLARHLETLGIASDEAIDGHAALEYLAEHAADVAVVLLDVVMPGLDGYATLEAIKSDEALRRLPVIMISGVDEQASVARCLEMGAADYLPKPFNPVILGARVRASLAEKRMHDLEAE